MDETKALAKYREWLNAKGMEPEMRRELQNMITDLSGIEERFCSDLEFGTAGLRAVMGSGTNRMNIYTVASAARGFAESVIAAGMAERGIVVSYDSRNNSAKFAEVTARVIASTGIAVLLSDRLRPVPMLSFAIRHYRAAGGVMITASHNPPQYNGFKVYGSDGGQIDPEEAARVKKYIENTGNVFELVRNSGSLKALTEQGMIAYMGEGLDNSYTEMLESMSDAEGLPIEVKRDLRIVYTPLNGSGLMPVMRILTELGFESVVTVPEQERPDGDFTTLRVPNPECEDTYDKAIGYARISMADIIIATDPDSDRLGVALPDMNGEYRVLTGNQIGVLLMEYILAGRAGGSDPADCFCTTSIVSGKLARSICRRYGVRLYETLTGSKYIAELIHDHDDNGSENFVMGFEEGNGYMIGTAVRDKDAVAAAMLIAEMAAAAKSRGKRLYEELLAIYVLYGYAAEKNISVTEEGIEGQTRIKKCMEHYRAMDGRLGEEGSMLFDTEVTRYTDLSPHADVLFYELGGMDWIALRPSGTEPKLKIYFGFYGEKEKAERELDRVSEAMLSDIDDIMNR